MTRSLLCLAMLVFSLIARAQLPMTAAEKAALDSMLKNDEFLKMMDSLGKPASYVDVSIGIGNREFSVKNNSVNTTQATTRKLFYTPAVVYHHKSGLSFGVMPFLASDSGALKVYQTALLPGYDYIGDKVSAGLSYTRYLADNKKWNSGSTYQNDVYAYVRGESGIIQPGFALGYSSGTYKEINAVLLTPPVGQPRIVMDSTSNKISDFSMLASIEHNFDFLDVFAKEDDLSIIPQLYLNAGSEKLAITHLNKAYERIVARSKRISSRTANANTGFALQSTSFSIDITYAVKKFFLQPNIYFDYYLPATDQKRLTTVFSVTAGFSFD